MKIHEFQAKEILASYNVPIQRGYVVSDVNNIEKIISKVQSDFQSNAVVVKAQIHAGGRGKGGGVKVVKSIADVKSASSSILGMQLITHQTGPEGQLVKRLLVEEGAQIDKEL